MSLPKPPPCPLCKKPGKFIGDYVKPVLVNNKVVGGEIEWNCLNPKCELQAMWQVTPIDT